MQNLQHLVDSFNALPEHHKKVLRKYRASVDALEDKPFAYKINEILRSGESPPDEVKEDINALDEAIKSARPLSYPMTVYRAVGDISWMGDLMPGKGWKDPGYVSTSTRRDNLPEHFYRPDFGPLTEAGVLTIQLPYGSPAVFLGGEAQSSKESEFLLGRNYEFEVVTREQGDLKRVAPEKCRYFSGLWEITLELKSWPS